VEGDPDITLVLDNLRLDIARCLALQVQLGIFWDLYDAVHQWSLIRGEFRAHLVPTNIFLTRKLESALNELGEQEPKRPLGDMLPAALDAQLKIKLADALHEVADQKDVEEDLHTATELLNEPGSAIRYTSKTASIAQRVANYLHTRRLIVAELSRLELVLRGYLGLSPEVPIRLGAAIFPTPKALPWYELIVGRKLGPDGHLTGSSTGVRLSAK
jgi:hypothetical protein